MTLQMKEYFPGLKPGTKEKPGARNLYRNHIKRGLDILLVLLSVPVIVPIVALFGLLIFVYDRHTPFYWSERVGRNGERFRMLKLRTMVRDADARLLSYLANDADAFQEWNATQKLRHDPRVTLLGRLLRKYSVDEIPQIWNVLRGDMSVVGPRPMMPNQRLIYPGEAYFDVRPGLTGPWQVSARNLTTFVERADFDDEYARELSFWTDLKLITLTVWVIVRGTGY